MSLKNARRGSFARSLKELEPDYSEQPLDGGQTVASKNEWFFEVAWEVANKGSTVQISVLFQFRKYRWVQ